MLIFEKNIIYRKKKIEETYLENVLEDQRPALEIPQNWEPIDYPIDRSEKEIPCIIEIDLA